MCVDVQGERIRHCDRRPKVPEVRCGWKCEGTGAVEIFGQEGPSEGERNRRCGRRYSQGEVCQVVVDCHLCMPGRRGCPGARGEGMRVHRNRMRWDCIC